MEQSKSKVSYSVLRYSPDEIKGEVINVGLILYNYATKSVICSILDEKSPKLKGILDNPVEYELYKTDTEIIKFYLDKCIDDVSGVVGQVYIASFYNEGFIEALYNHYSDKRLRLSRPGVAYTKDAKRLFDTIMMQYIGESNILPDDRPQIITAKKYMKNIIDSNQNLKSRIITDKIINPVKGLNAIQMKVDFTFRNGKWNYMQTIPNVIQQNKNVDWYSKIELMLQNEDIRQSRIHLLYKNTDIVEDMATYHSIKYLQEKYDNICILDVERKNDVDNLCHFIEKEGQILEAI